MKLITFRTRNTQSLSLFALIFTMLFLQACSEPQAIQQQENYTQLADVQTFIRHNTYQVTREYTGKITAKQRTQLSFEYAGRIKNIAIDSGDIVKKDQVLASLDVELLHIKTNELKAQIEQIDAQIILNKANLKRVSSLIKNNYASEQKIDELTAEQAVLSATHKGLEASLASLTYQIAKAQLKAPYDGVVFERLVSNGDLVNAGMPAFTVVNQHEQEIVVGVPAHLASQLNTSDVLPVRIGQNQHEATIIAIGRQIDASNRTVQLRLRLPESLDNISGLIAKIAIPQTLEKSGFWIPLTALTDGIRGQWNVYLILSTASGNSNVIVPQTVNVEHTTSTQAYISGVDSDELKLVRAGLHRYVPGQIVRVNNVEQTGDK